ncbi:hypothetical protein QVD17_15710 [Tagetes erecta]|uniref:Uncharacterized protein n=1 Tax=Tagetes erecta TaxID=13708 RepID=A0AAD8KSV6_TARER|nr:hypothetical protein QVD17_15710 [Tagetes erecta]
MHMGRDVCLILLFWRVVNYTDGLYLFVFILQVWQFMDHSCCMNQFDAGIAKPSVKGSKSFASQGNVKPFTVTRKCRRSRGFKIHIPILINFANQKGKALSTCRRKSFPNKDLINELWRSWCCREPVEPYESSMNLVSYFKVLKQQIPGFVLDDKVEDVVPKRTLDEEIEEMFKSVLSDLTE